MLSRWLARSRTSHPCPHRRQPRTRLSLEPLEVREVPATFTVTTPLDAVSPTDGKLSLREAVTRANDTAGADVIVLPAGLFKITTPTGSFVLTDTVTVRGAGASQTVVYGNQAFRVFDAVGTAPHSIGVTFQGLTIRGGLAPSNGGGIRVSDADLIVRDCLVDANRAFMDGGGIATLNAADKVSLIRTAVARNVAGRNGGGLSVLGELTVTGCTIRRNAAPIAGGVYAGTATLTGCTVAGNSSRGPGGGVWATTANLTGCTVARNSAGLDGGGIEANTATLLNTTVTGNFAAASGGGLFAASATLSGTRVSGNTAALHGGGLSATMANLSRSTVSGNSAGGSGGGVNAATATLRSSTFAENTATLAGGGIFATTAIMTNSTVADNTAGGEGGGVNAMTATLLNCTIAENIAQSGGGLFHAAGGTFSVMNTIVASNMLALVETGGTGPDLAGALFSSGGHNLIGHSPGVAVFPIDVSSDFLDVIDPKLGPLANHGGPTQTMALLAGSPAIDAGDNLAIDPVTGDPVTTDQRGVARKKDGNGNGVAFIDIGAFER